jgi:thiamine biosynthesis lipoprotein
MKKELRKPQPVVKILLLSALVGSAIILGFIYRRAPQPNLYRQSQFALYTNVEITVSALNERDAQKAMSDAFAEMRRLDALLSRYQEDSQITRINRSSTKDQFIAADREVLSLLQRSFEYSVLTDGMFDMTVGPLVDLWRIGTDQARVPDKSEIQAILQYVDYTHVHIDEERGVKLHYPGVNLDLGAVAKGYAVDQGIEVLKSHNISSALINAGGDLRCLGARPDGTPWRIGIQHPRKSGLLGVVELNDSAVATSGDYQQYFMDQETRYHHIFHPTTGIPASECQSVTITAQTAEMADVLATAVFVMGPEQGMAFIEAKPDVEGMIVHADGEIIVSSGFSFEAE